MAGIKYKQLKNKKWLHEQYVIKKKTAKEISKVLGCSDQAVLDACSRLGIKKRKPSDYRAWNKGLGLSDPRVREMARKSKASRIKKGSTRGSKHYNWKGAKVSYKALHAWIRRHKGSPEKCFFCGGRDRLEWANISGEYKRDLTDYLSCCRDCHIKFDLKDECKHGHKYTNSNTYITKEGWRKCRECARIAYHKRKEV
jgi:hypothetical protein